MPFLRLPVHAEIEYAIKLAMTGAESSVITGRRGVGKTFALEHLVSKAEQKEVEACLEDRAYRPRQILRYETSGATGTKTVLLDLHRLLIGPVSGMGQRSTPLELLDQIVGECQYRNLTLICVDEAQLLSLKNLELLRQVPDRARALGHPLGLVVVGSEELRDSLVAIRQLGQRFASEIRLHGLSESDFAAHWTDLHPHLPALRASLKPKDWTALEKLVRVTVNAKMRRLSIVLNNANTLALQWNRPVDEAIIRAAVSRISPEH